MRLIAAAACAAVLLAGAGCTIDRASGDDEAVAEEPGSGQATKDGNVVVEGEEVEQRPSYAAVLPYVKALAAQDQALMRKAQRAASPGTVAAAYMSVQADMDAAGSDAGYGRDEVGSVTVLDADGSDGPEDARYRACFEDDDEQSYCYTYADFTVDDENRVQSFTVDGEPLQGRLSTDGWSARGELGDFLIRGAYVTASGRLAVTGVLQAGDEAVLIEDGTNYRVGKGHRNVVSVIGAETLEAGRKSAYALYFSGPVRIGGVLHLIVAQADGGGAEILDVKVR